MPLVKGIHCSHQTVLNTLVIFPQREHVGHHLQWTKLEAGTEQEMALPACKNQNISTLFHSAAEWDQEKSQKAKERRADVLSYNSANVT